MQRKYLKSENASFELEILFQLLRNVSKLSIKYQSCQKSTKIDALKHKMCPCHSPIYLISKKFIFTINKAFCDGMYYQQQNKWYPKYFYLPILKLHLILAVVNLLAHNNKSQICYCGQISLQSAAVNCSFCDTVGGIIYFAAPCTYRGCYPDL